MITTFKIGFDEKKLKAKVKPEIVLE